MSERETIIAVSPEGDLSFVWDDSLAPLCGEGVAVVSRASHVEPSVGGRWCVDLGPVGGPVRDGFVLRSEAIEFELDWIRENLGL